MSAFYSNNTSLSSILVGNQWSNAALSALGCNSVSCSSNGQYATMVAGDGSLWTSSNFGSTWSQCTFSFVSPPMSAVISSNGNVILTGNNTSGLLVLGSWNSSTNAFEWSTLPNSPVLESGYSWQSFCINQTGTSMAAVYYGYSASFVYQSTDGGANWFLTGNTLPSTGYSWNSICMNASGDCLCVASYGPATGTGIYCSVDSGATWTLGIGTDTLNSWNSVVSSSTGQYVYAVTNTQMFMSSNYGVNWTSLSGPTLEASQKFSSVATTGDGVKVYVSVAVNGGSVWVNPSLGADGDWLTLYNSPIVDWSCICVSSTNTLILGGTYSYSTNELYSFLKCPDTQFVCQSQDLSVLFKPQLTEPTTYVTTNFVMSGFVPLWATEEGVYDVGEVFEPIE